MTLAALSARVRASPVFSDLPNACLISGVVFTILRSLQTANQMDTESFYLVGGGLLLSTAVSHVVLSIKERYETQELRERNHALNIPPSDFKKLMLFFGQHHIRVEFAVAMEVGTLLDQTILDLSNSWVRSLPRAIGHLTNLEELYLGLNHLERLPPEIRRLRRLKKLDLHFNRLWELPQEIGELTALQELNLTSTELNTLPRWIGKLTALRKLELSCNRLTTLPIEIERLRALTRLDFVGNRLTACPEEIGELTALKELDFGDNRLERLPEALGKLARLEQLLLYDNQLTTLPASMRGLTSLRKLALQHNRLMPLPAVIGELPALTELYLSNNNLTLLPDWIDRLLGLESLYLDQNRLTALPNSVGNLAQLQLLEIGYNPQLGALPLSLSNCTLLTHIGTERTAISLRNQAPILRATQEARGLEGAAKLPAKLAMWRTLGEITADWPELTDEQQKINLYEWLLRLEQTRDFKQCQIEMVEITCQILTTVFNDEIFREEFFSLIASDLAECGDRAAMSLNLACTEWRLHLLPADAGLKAIVQLLVGYAKTLKLRQIIDRDHGHKRESVERFLYAEIHLEKLGLVTAVRRMLHEGCGSDVDLNAIEQEIMTVEGRALSDAEFIHRLTWWQRYLERENPEGIKKARELANEQLDEGGIERPPFKGPKEEARWMKEKYDELVYLPLTQELLAK